MLWRENERIDAPSVRIFLFATAHCQAFLFLMFCVCKLVTFCKSFRWSKEYFGNKYWLNGESWWWTCWWPLVAPGNAESAVSGTAVTAMCLGRGGNVWQPVLPAAELQDTCRDCISCSLGGSCRRGWIRTQLSSHTGWAMGSPHPTSLSARLVEDIVWAAL